MTRDEAIAALDACAEDMVRAYRDLGRAAAVIRTDGARLKMFTLGTMDAGIAKLLYVAADTMANRAYEDKQCKPNLKH